MADTTPDPIALRAQIESLIREHRRERARIDDAITTLENVRAALPAPTVRCTAQLRLTTGTVTGCTREVLHDGRHYDGVNTWDDLALDVESGRGLVPA